MVSDTSLLGLRQLLARGVWTLDDATKPVFGACGGERWRSSSRTLPWNNGTPHSGLWMAAPLPALYEPELLLQLQGWVWAPESLEHLGSRHAALPGSGPPGEKAAAFRRLALGPEDGDDPFLLVFTPELQLALAIHGPADERQLLMRCDADSLSDTLTLLGERLNATEAGLAEELRGHSPGWARCTATRTSTSFWPRLAELTGVSTDPDPAVAT